MAYLDAYQCTSPASRVRRLTYSFNATNRGQYSMSTINYRHISILTVIFTACWLWLLTSSDSFATFIRNNTESGPLLSSELVKARQRLIKVIQGMTYREKLSYLLKRQSRCPPLIRQLCLFLDNDKLICCGGKIHNAPTTELAKFPVLLPANSSFINLIIMDTHSKLHHGGMSITVTALRQVYWIPSIWQCIREDVKPAISWKENHLELQISHHSQKSELQNPHR